MALQAPAGEHDVAARLCKLGAFRERDCHIGAGQHGRIVDTVAYHEHASAIGAQFRQPCKFLGR